MKRENLCYETIKTDVGNLTIIAHENKIIRIDFATLPQIQEKAKVWFKRYFDDVIFTEKCNATELAAKQLNEYFAHNREIFSLPYQLYGTNFQQSVWKAIVKSVPYGETNTYKQVGEKIDNVRAVRAIGGALNKNPISIVIPCHRIIGSSGKLVGYGGGLDKKSHLLELEHLS